MLYIDAVNNIEDDDNRNWLEEISILGNKIKMKLDTGAQCNVLPQNIVSRLELKLIPSKTKSLVGFGNNKIKVIGEVDALCKVREQDATINFKVVAEKVFPILGKKACEVLNLVLRVNEIQVDNKIFDGQGCVKNFIYDIDLKENPVLRIHPARKIPHALRESVKKEIDKMVDLGVLVKTKDATEAVSPMVVAKKKMANCVCV